MLCTHNHLSTFQKISLRCDILQSNILHCDTQQNNIWQIDQNEKERGRLSTVHLLVLTRSAPFDIANLIDFFMKTSFLTILSLPYLIVEWHSTR